MIEDGFELSIRPNEYGYVILTTTYEQLKTFKTVYAVIKSNTKEKYHKIELIH